MFGTATITLGIGPHSNSVLYYTSGQNNLTSRHITTAHGRFVVIHQVAAGCTPPNTCFVEPTQVQIPNGISICSAVFAQLLTKSRHIIIIIIIKRKDLGGVMSMTARTPYNTRTVTKRECDAKCETE